VNLIKIILLPFAIIFGCITFVRNKLFDWKILPSEKYNIPVISVGNLSVGGTGKTPQVEYIIQLLLNKYKVATLSRGYKRTTHGFRLATKESTYKEIGDESLLFKNKFSDIHVAVDENRRNGIKILMKHFPELEVIILDDAFQHRYVIPGLSILTTDFHNIYANNFLLPSGTLREFKCGAKRADIIIVTKTRKVFSPITKRRLTGLIKPMSHQYLFFTYIDYGEIIPLNPKDVSLLKEDIKTILMFSGIANSYPLQEHLRNQCNELVIMDYPDHHAYTMKDLDNIKDNFDRIFIKNKIIVTTEKDAIRLKNSEFSSIIKKLPIFYIPIEIKFHKGDNAIFDARIIEYVEKNRRIMQVHTKKDKSET
jgi:tetraacyldisaccharide 4'-kinase